MKGTALCVVCVALLTGCSDDLDVKTQNKVGYAWDHVTDACYDVPKPTPRSLDRARRALGVLIDQYNRTPDGRAQLIESDDTVPMREILREFAEPDERRWSPRCAEIQRTAARAVKA